MQVNGNCPNFGQLDVQIRCGIFRKLRKQQRFQLPVLFESGKTKTSVLKILPTFMKLFDDLLKNLRKNFTQPRKLFLGFRQVVELIDFIGKFLAGRQDVLFFKRASVNRTLATIAPIFNLPQRIVECTATNFHPLNECLLLSGIWIDSVAVVKCQHSAIVQDLLADLQMLNVKVIGSARYREKTRLPRNPILTDN